VPLLAIGISLRVLAHYGMPDPPPVLEPKADSYVEAAARLRMLATWIVMAGLAIGSFAYFLIDLLKFEKRSFSWLLAVFVVLFLGMVAQVLWKPDFGRAEQSIGKETICMAFGGKPPSKPAAPAKAGAPDSAPPKAGKTKALGAPECKDVVNVGRMHELNGVQLYLLLLVLPAMVLGTISTLAEGAPARDQAGRLKIYLYLSAALFVAGLLYLSALLRWPGANLAEPVAAHYYAFVDAYLLSLGAAYSLFIVSYYLPAAAWLSAKANPTVAFAARDKKENEDKDDVLTFFDILKVALALFAPVITALLGNVVKL